MPRTRAFRVVAIVKQSLICALLVGGSLFVGLNDASANDRTDPHEMKGPIVLTLRDMDMVTAGASVVLNLTANGTGSNVVTNTTGSVQSGTATVYQVTIDPNAPAFAAAHLVDAFAAEVYYASGQASATGSTGANCSAQAALTGDFVFKQQMSTTVTAPNSILCSCTAFAIAALPH